MKLPAPIVAMVTRPPLVARLGVAVCAAVFLAYGFLALADVGAAAGPSADQAARAPDGPVSGSGEVARIFVEQPAQVTVLFLRGADGLEFRLDGDASRAYGQGDFVRVDGEKAGNVVHAQTVRRTPSPWAVAAAPVAVGATLAGLLAADFFVPFVVGRAMPWNGLVARLAAGRSARKVERDDEAALEDR